MMMFSFNGFLTEAKNLHLEHLEDEVLNNGVVGTRGAINFLQSLRDMLAGSAKSSVNVTVKWDGAPAIFAGINPENGQFFVGTKGVFNKNAKINYTIDDIDRNHPGIGLNQKLKVALTELSKLGITDVIQGDMMFTQDDLEKKTIDGKQYVTFQPNTIVYAVPMESASRILSSTMGIVFHTTYSGNTMEDMSASFTVNLRGLDRNAGVWFSNADYKDTSGTINFNKAETKEITKILSQAGKTFHTLKADVLTTISNDKDLKILIKTFNNTKVRTGEKITNTRMHTAGLIAWIYDRYKKEVEKVKRPETKKIKQLTMDNKMKFFRSNSSQLVKIFDMQNLLVDAKDQIIRKLEKSKGVMDTFVRTSTGYKVTQPEGFVAIDKLGKAVKLVDRLEFAHQNFTAAKAWNK
tara:strand:+ start:755 stop:1975 length:1221 start_codon:yes stop_codon:yes gene_type:complete